jgi:hypothetical protein
MTTQKITTQAKSKTPFNWRLFWVLLGVVAFGLIVLIPYGLTLSGQTFSIEILPQLVVQFIGQIALYSVLILVGLTLASKVGLGVPWLESWLKRERVSSRKKLVGNTILLGLIAGIAMLVLDIYLFAPPLTEQLETLGETVRPPAWQGFLAAFYG